MIRTKTQSTIQQMYRQETGLSQASPRGRIYLPLFSLVLLMSTVLFLAGCSNFQSLAAKSATQESTRVTETTIAATPTPTPTPTATPTPSPTPTPEGLTVDQLLAEAPEIAGLSKEIENGKVVYKAFEGNEYGLEVGKYAGEYNQNIVMEGEVFGNISLIPVVAEHVLNDQLGEIPDGENKLKVLLPMDSTQAGESKINISFEKDIFNNYMAIITCNSRLDVLNNMPNARNFIVFWYSKDGVDFMCPLSVDTFGDSDVATNETILTFLQTSVNNSNFDRSKDGTPVDIPFGSIIGYTSNGNEIILSCADAETSYQIDSSTFVKIDNAFVSMTSER